MSTEKERKEIISKLRGLRKEVDIVNRDLNRINNEKEKWFKEKSDISEKINDSIGKIKELRKKRDELTLKVKKAKENRDKINKDVREKISNIKKVRDELSNLKRKFKLNIDPSKISDEIDSLEMRIETEGMSFSKEKKVMDKIRYLKKILKDVFGKLDIKKVNELSNEIDNLKKEGDRIHREIQEWAKESQKCHEEIISLSKEIDKLKPAEEKAMKKFIELKNRFKELNDKLKTKLGEVAEINAEINKNRKDELKRKVNLTKKELEKKEREVEEKIKRGKKITTDDLLIFQSTIEKEK